jgi:hypothetical protein
MKTFIALLLSCGMAQAHERWSNGKPIPNWVRDQCCGLSEAHDLDEEGIPWHVVKGGYKIDGFSMLITKAYPSEDDHAWAFYTLRRANANVSCFFAPVKY